MAVNIPPSPAGKQDLRLPHIPPLLHTRSGNELYDRPHTPTQGGFTSPLHTPHGSPSKNRMPPGAIDLPNVFDNAMKLTPSSPSKSTFNTYSPGKSGLMMSDDMSSFNESVIYNDNSAPGSPTRRSNKENTPPSALRLPKDGPVNLNQAALSRQGQYQSREPLDGTGRRTTRPRARGLTAEELEKLQLPNVKRLANVTQLYFLDHYFDILSYVHNRQTRHAQFQASYPPPPTTSSAVYEPALQQYLGRERANLRKRRTRLRHGDFQILTQVGQGGYGQVYLAQKRDTREVCALKVMSKKLLFKLDEIRHILTERDILTAAKSEWLVKLLYAFQDDTQIYLAMEYVPGGDFRTLLNNTGVLHNRHARFYISEMVQCVDSLHLLGYIHRDLKPENFLIDSTGHVKLTDFGLAAGMLSPGKIESMRVKLEEVGNTPVPFGRPMEHRSMAERREGYRSLRLREVNYAKSIVGSPDYMAPEVLKGEEYDFTVDYWSLGCMLFEALAGYPPFAGSTVDETWQNLKRWQKVLRKPQYEDPNYFLSRRTWDLITRMVAAKEQRFKNIQEIHAHDYFAEVNFNALREEQRPPFVPELDSETDAGYFDDFSSESDMAKYKEVHDKQKALEDMADRGDKMGKGLFVGFTFRHRKPAVDSDGRSSPRKAIPTDGSFGTIF
ncbi:AGC/NDR/NDR-UNCLASSIFIED protein kinase [Polytolypa hystricis UAMH7299]|uniref:non-specific serine/threonine protein kinase n=1 Tax=Polytolypa hystricis (strain UAMH7299) TaxID=1447883 RepID=A0A2B7XWP1_POLH7|nr:AGC/NDR/NDR-UNCLASSIFIED protein kinase [Polytolypa hystricis UAMH7299]